MKNRSPVVAASTIDANRNGVYITANADVAITTSTIRGGSCGDSTDQRGLPRPVDDPVVPNVADGCDVGAFEKQ